MNHMTVMPTLDFNILQFQFVILYQPNVIVRTLDALPFVIPGDTMRVCHASVFIKTPVCLEWAHRQEMQTTAKNRWKLLYKDLG